MKTNSGKFGLTRDPTRSADGPTCVHLYHRLLDSKEHTGWPKKVSNFQVSSLNRVKNRHKGYIFINFDKK